MTKYEFCWTIEPARQRRFQRRRRTDVFDVEISGDNIFVRTDFIVTSEDELRAQAEDMAKNLVRAMADRERQRLSLGFNHIKRTTETFGQSDISLRFEERLPEMRDEVSWTKVGYVKLDAVLVERSEDGDLDEVFRLSERARQSPSLQKMLDWKAAFYADSEKKLAPLYDVLELVPNRVSWAGEGCPRAWRQP